MVDKSNQRVTQGNTKTEKQNFACFEVNQQTTKRTTCTIVSMFFVVAQRVY